MSPETRKALLEKLDAILSWPVPDKIKMRIGVDIDTGDIKVALNACCASIIATARTTATPEEMPEDLGILCAHLQQQNEAYHQAQQEGAPSVAEWLQKMAADDSKASAPEGSPSSIMDAGPPVTPFDKPFSDLMREIASVQARHFKPSDN